MLRTVPLFQNLTSSFLRVIVMKLEPKVCLAGDYLVHFGEELTALHFGECPC